MAEDNITKTELEAFTIATTKSTAILEKISGTLTQFSIQNEKVVARLYNGISKEIVEGIIKEMESEDEVNELENQKLVDNQIKISKSIVDLTVLITNMKKGLATILILIGATGFIIAVAGVVLNHLHP